MVWVSDQEDEIVTRVSPYNFAMLNSTETSHLGKTIISTNWWNQFWWKIWCWNWDMWGNLSAKFQTHRSSNFRDTAETVWGISGEEIGKLGLPVPRVSLHYFQKRSTLDSSPWRDIYFYPIIFERFQVLKIRVSLTNPISASSGSRTDTSNR